MTPPYHREWLRDGQILCFRLSDLSRLTMDTWYNDMVEFYRSWPSRTPLLLLIVVPMEKPVVSENVVQRVTEASSVRPQVAGRTAFLIADQSLAQNLSALLRENLPLGVRQRRVFASEHEAAAWLLEPAALT